MLLADKVKALPLTPGVYLMKDSRGAIIYVGKAKRLKRRVASYFQQSRSHPPKVRMMVGHIRDLEYRETDTEFEAFMLECRLIKELKPMYNKKMKSPQAYTYLRFTEQDGLLRMDTAYSPDEADGSQCFGPYTSRHTVERAILGMKETMHILCSHSRRGPSYCLHYSLGLCLGMCKDGDQDAAEQYNRIMGQIIHTLEGKDTSILEAMERKMEEAAARFDFETAAKFRDYQKAVQSLLQKARVIHFAEANRSIAVLEAMENSRAKLIVLQGSRIIHTSVYGLESGRTEAMLHAASEAVQASLCMAAASGAASVRAVTRDDIDEAQIIYSYLKSGGAGHAVIRKEWLKPGGEKALKDALGRSLEASMKKLEEEAGETESSPDT